MAWATWAAEKEVDRRWTMTLLLHATSARARKPKTRAGGAAERVSTVSPSQTARTAVRLWAVTSSCWG